MNLPNRWLGLLLAALLLVACGGTSAPETENALPSAEDEPTPAVEVPAPQTPTTASEEESPSATEEEDSAEEDSSSAEGENASGDEAASGENAEVGEEGEPATVGGGAIEAPELPDIPTLSDKAITSDSGLQYEDTVVGDGTEVSKGDLVFAHYTGYLEDGTVFDSSVPRGEPFSTPVGAGRVIPGWDEGLVGMKVGGERILVIPPELAYGAEERGNIPANSTLTFHIEMLEVQKPATPAAVEYITAPTGVEYAIVEEGEGDEVAVGDLVDFNYNAWIEDGILFDSSDQTGRPAQLPLGQSGLKGLDLGIEGMKAGEKRQIRIPPELAYGDEGAGGVIPPGATIIFEVTLLEFASTPKLNLADEASYVKTDSGLEYAILSEGDGAVAKEGDMVVVNYSGWLEDGTLFDSSIPRGAPFTFLLGEGGVIKGWDEGVAGMKIGEKRQLRIPADLGYGEMGSPPTIPANATLIFDVELMEIQAE